MSEVSNGDEVLDRKQILLNALHWAQQAEKWCGGGDTFYGGDPKAAAAISQAWSVLAAGLKSEPTVSPPVKEPAFSGVDRLARPLHDLVWSLQRLTFLLKQRLPDREEEPHGHCSHCSGL